VYVLLVEASNKMTYDDESLKKLIQELVNDKTKSSLLFRFIDIRDQEILGQTQLIRQFLNSEDIKNFVAQNPNDKPFYDFFKVITEIYSTMNNEIKFIHFILEAMLLKTIDLPTTRIEREKMVSQEDRQILDWLKGYMKHTPGEDKMQ
jgi:hypothetical protein